MKSDKIKEFDIKTNAEFRQLGMTVENWTPPSFDLAVVPKELHDLIPLARRWGISCDVTRHDAAEKASKAELAEVARLLSGRHTQVYRWYYSHWPSPSVEACAFSDLLVFEMEEVDGPGIPGLLHWRIQEFKRDPSEENRGLLRSAYEYFQSWDSTLKKHLPMEEAKALLENT